MRHLAVLALLLCTPSLAAGPRPGEEKEKKGGWSADTWKGLPLRPLGPALNSGRIADLAVDPRDPDRWFVAAASGGVWRTENHGVTWTPVFDQERSYSIGCVAIDPRNPFVVWVGTGENNAQRSVGYGDGVYRSEDGGKSWKRMGLERSEHIGRILVHPGDSNVVFAAAQGPLWGPGGDRGLYRTRDGGRTWKAVLTVSENTGVSDVVMDPRNPDVLLATAWQRRRHVFTMIGGGPESAIYKSTDGGETWRKVARGLPEKEDLGRIGLAVSPVDPDVVYATVEAFDKKARGTYRSTDRGETWERRGDFAAAGLYYGEIFADPRSRDRLYAMDVFLRVSDDGGKTFRPLGEQGKHVDNHVLWVDPSRPEHMLAGCDGGLYETFDGARTWSFFQNLPITQFYRVAADDGWPVYRVYGGTQDNFTLGGPSRTLDHHGIKSQDWSVVWNGDGFQPRAEPGNPDLVYAEEQYGGLVRFDRRSGEALPIQPKAAPGEEPLRWNWDSPLLVSPHDPARLWFAAQRVFRSDDRGASWQPASPDLSRRIDRNTLPVMGRVWGSDAVARGASTSFYGNVVALDESPLAAGLLYAGTDDGLVQVSEDSGRTWRRQDRFPGVPDRAYVSRLVASRHDAGVVYAAFNAHKDADFGPYLLRSADRGRSWSSVAGDLPARGSLWALAEDPVDRDLLFAGTEFGLFFTRDGGRHWIRLQGGGFPVIAVRDLAIQARESDLVVGTFGRGIWILDDYSPLRAARPADLEKEALVFPARKALGYVPAEPLGYRRMLFLGSSFFLAPNPPYGAILTWYLKDGLETRREKRRKAESEAVAAGKPIRYPAPEELRAEAAEEEPAVMVTILDADGKTVRRLLGPPGAGVHRIAWDLRWPPFEPATRKPPAEDSFDRPAEGPMAVPGRYRARFEKRVDGVLTPLGEQVFEVEALARGALPPGDPAGRTAFAIAVGRLQRAVLGAVEATAEQEARLSAAGKALVDAPAADPRLFGEVKALDGRLRDLVRELKGDEPLRRRNEVTPASIAEQVQGIVETLWESTAAPTATSRRSYAAAAASFEPALGRLRALDADLRRLEAALEAAGAPWSPGRIPEWRRE
jgi:photosystem II stability/assembly factor-like uncharacterized protein